MAYAHPILFRRLEAAKAARPEMTIIVVDPRRTDTCELADLHLAIAPGTDVALFHGLLHLLLANGDYDPAYIDAHTEGFEALRGPGGRLPAERSGASVRHRCGRPAPRRHTDRPGAGLSLAVVHGPQPVHGR